MQYSLNGVKTAALWAQVSIVPIDWISKNLSDAKIQRVQGLLGINNLDLKAANVTALLYSG